jgi:hypothetical protein
MYPLFVTFLPTLDNLAMAEKTAVAVVVLSVSKNQILLYNLTGTSVTPTPTILHAEADPELILKVML